MKLIVSYIDLRTNKEFTDKPVSTNNISNLVKVLHSFGYHVTGYYHTSGNDELKNIKLGGYIHETQQSREVCPETI